MEPASTKAPTFTYAGGMLQVSRSIGAEHLPLATRDHGYLRVPFSRDPVQHAQRDGAPCYAYDCALQSLLQLGVDVAVLTTHTGPDANRTADQTHGTNHMSTASRPKDPRASGSSGGPRSGLRLVAAVAWNESSG